MKKIFTLLSALCLFGLSYAKADDVTINLEFVGSANGVTVVKGIDDQGKYTTETITTNSFTLDNTQSGIVCFIVKDGYAITSITSDSNFKPQKIQAAAQADQYNGNYKLNLTTNDWYLEYNSYNKPVESTFTITVEEQKNVVTFNLIDAPGDERPAYWYVYEGSSTDGAPSNAKSNVDGNTHKYVLTDQPVKLNLYAIDNHKLGNVTTDPSNFFDNNSNASFEVVNGWYSFTINAVEENYGAVINIPVLPDLSNAISFNWTLPTTADNPFIISSLEWLGTETKVTATDINDYYVLFNSNVTDDTDLQINFATDADGKAVYDIGSVTASYTVKGSDVKTDINPAWIYVADNNTNATVKVPYDVNCNEMFITVKTADQGMSVTFNVDDPEAITVSKVSNGEVVTLDGESTVIELAFGDNLTFKAADEGYKITEAVYGSGQSISVNDVTLVYTTEDLNDGMTINVTTETVTPPSQYKDSFTVEVGAEAAEELTSLTINTENATFATITDFAEPTEVMFDASANASYQIVAAGSDNATIYTYFDGISKGATPLNQTKNVFFGAPANGSVINFYASAQETSSVQFVAAGTATGSEINVQVNGIRPFSEWSNATSFTTDVLEGTYFNITVPSDYEITVNDKALTPESSSVGVATYNYTVKAANSVNTSTSGDQAVADFTIVITGAEAETPDDDGEDEGSSAVNTIGVDLNDSVIYNLQGVRVSADKLTRGIYVINGKKVLVK